MLANKVEAAYRRGDALENAERSYALMGGVCGRYLGPIAAAKTALFAVSAKVGEHWKVAVRYW